MRQPDMLDRLGATLVRLAPYLVLAVLFLAGVGICTAQDMFRVVRGGWRREEPSTPASPWPQYDKTIFIYEHNTDLDEFGRIIDSSFVGTNYGYPTGTVAPLSQISTYVSPAGGRWHNEDTAVVGGGYFLNGLTQVTYSVWADITQFRAYAGLIFSRGTYNYGLGRSSSDTKVSFYPNNTLGVLSYTNPISFMAEPYHHICVTWTALDASRLYINGVLVQTTAAGTNTTIIGQNDSLKLAYDDFDTARAGIGYQDDEALWSVALTSNEVWQLYTNGHGGTVPVISGDIPTTDESAYPHTNYLAFRYQFNQFTNEFGKIVDTSPHGTNTATPGTGGELPTYISPSEGCYFTDDYIAQDGMYFNNATEFTWSVWACLSNHSSYAIIMGTEYLKTDKRRVVMQFDNSIARVKFTHSKNIWTDYISMSTGEWMNITAVWKGGAVGTNCWVYTNGVLHQKMKTPYHPFDQGTNLWIGRTYYDDRGFIGKIDDPAGWLKALSSQEVYNVFTSGH